MAFQLPKGPVGVRAGRTVRQTGLRLGNGMTALQESDSPLWVVETHSLTVGNVIRRCQFANGSNPT